MFFISDGLGVAKPDPYIFEYVARKKQIAPSRLIYVGDSWTNDVVPPIVSGWNSIWYNHRNRPQTFRCHKETNNDTRNSQYIEAIVSLGR
jgi:FMN phosphatase YigB (HAD superfamily)